MQSPLRNWSRSEKIALGLWTVVGLLLLVIIVQTPSTQETGTGHFPPLYPMKQAQSSVAILSTPAPFPPRRQTPDKSGGNRAHRVN